jgi:hypothetical protein
MKYNFDGILRGIYKPSIKCLIKSPYPYLSNSANPLNIEKPRDSANFCVRLVTHLSVGRERAFNSVHANTATIRITYAETVYSDKGCLKFKLITIIVNAIKTTRVTIVPSLYSKTPNNKNSAIFNLIASLMKIINFTSFFTPWNIIPIPVSQDFSDTKGMFRKCTGMARFFTRP